MVYVAQLRRGVYATEDSRALVIVKRRLWLAEIMAMVVAFASFLVPWYLALDLTMTLARTTGWLPWLTVVLPAIAVVGALIALWLVVGVRVLARPAFGEVGLKPVDGDTPKKNRWSIESLAARDAGDGLDAFLLARRTLAEFPRGRTLIAVARTKRLLRAYKALGFTHTSKHRVHRET